MHSSATFGAQIDSLVSKVARQAGWVLRVFRTRSRLPMLTLFKSLVLPHLDSFWGFVASFKTRLDKLLAGVPDQPCAPNYHQQPPVTVLLINCQHWGLVVYFLINLRAVHVALLCLISGRLASCWPVGVDGGAGGHVAWRWHHSAAVHWCPKLQQASKKVAQKICYE